MANQFIKIGFHSYEKYIVSSTHFNTATILNSPVSTTNNLYTGVYKFF